MKQSRFKICSKCSQKKRRSDFPSRASNSDGLYSWCRQCCSKICKEYREANKEFLNARSRAYHQKNKIARNKTRMENYKNNKQRDYAKVYEWKRRNKDKYTSHTFVNNAIKLGYIEKQPCYVCDNPKTEAHHEDYSLPNDILWLCKTCHSERHRDLNEIKRLSK